MRCWGGLLATTSMARSNLAHASGNKLVPTDESDFFDMQPLSRFKKGAPASFGREDTMILRPKIAVRIAECMMESADIETFMGMLLGLILNTDSNAALAMFAAVESRGAQRSMLLAAANAKYPQHSDLLTVTFTASVTPAMRARDKLAHWCWGISDVLPNVLLLTQPDEKMKLHYVAVAKHKKAGKADVPFDESKIFVVTEKDLIRTCEKLRAAKKHLQMFMGIVWNLNTPEERAEALRLLSNEPLIRAALERQSEARKKNPEAPPPDP
jgi:hypothetical protein